MKKVNQTPSYGFYSKVLNKPFDTLEELQAAEEKVLMEQEAKAKAAADRKTEAAKVEEAFKARNAARREYNSKVMEARKAYNTTLVEAKKAFDAAINEATAAKDKAEVEYNTALKEFTDKHQTYHMTLKDGDNVMTISNQSDKGYESISKEYNNLIDTILNIWKF